MGWLGDIAMLVALGVGGYWFLTNYKSLGIGGGGGSTAPTGTEVPPLEAGTEPTVPGLVPGEEAARIAMGLSPREECLAAGATVVDALCKTYKGVDYVQTVRSNGAKCIPTVSCGENISIADSKVKKKALKCKCNHTPGIFSAQEAAKGAKAGYYYSSYAIAARPYKLSRLRYGYGHASGTGAVP